MDSGDRNQPGTGFTGSGTADDSSFDFSSDEAANESMKQFIRDNFSDLLGDKVELLDEPDGLEKIKTAMEDEIQEASRELPKNLRKLMKFLQS